LVVFVTGAYLVWDFLGKPGLPKGNLTERTACLELYFYDSAVAYLVPVHRRVELAPNDSRTERAVHEFALGPRDPSLARVYPANIPVPSVRKEKDVAVVDLPAEISDYWGGPKREQEFLNALTMTVVSTGECSSVRILVAGSPQVSTPGGISLEKPLEKPNVINQVWGSYLTDTPAWATAYFLDSTGRYLFPLSMEISSGADPAVKAVKALLSMPPIAVEPPPRPVAPMGYSLDRLVIENGLATVDINVTDPQMAFMTSDINLFRGALFLTLRDCCNVVDVAIRLNGRPIEMYGRFSNLPALSMFDCFNIENTNAVVEQPEPSAGSQEGI
jgi:hypothetical protein